MTIKQIGQFAPIYSERNPGHDQEEWTAVRTLIERLNQLEQRKARISTLTSGNTQSATMDIWTPLVLSAASAHLPPVNFTASVDRVTYTGATPTNVSFFASIYVAQVTTSLKAVGLSKNGGDPPFFWNIASTNRTEFSTSIETSIDVEANDYLQVMYRTSVSTDTDFLTAVSTNISSTGFGVNA